MRAALASLLDLIAPTACAACGEDFPRAPPLCASCREALLPAEETPEGVRAAFLHGGPIAAAIHRAKYGDDPAVARGLGALLRAWIPRGDAVIVPIPLHRKRLSSRGFNQSAVLAVAAAGRSRVRVDVLARLRDTPSQTSLDRDQRRSNLDGAFTVARPARVRGRLVVVVDDVVTTGATMRAAMGALREAGAAETLGVALASAALRHARVEPGGQGA